MSHICPLGQPTVYIETYSPELLFPISRSFARDKIALSDPLPFKGVDIWTGYELSWLNSKGKPEIAVADFIFSCTSPNVVESKSVKLYLNSINQSHFDSFEQVQHILQKDLSAAAAAPVQVSLYTLQQSSLNKIEDFKGFCLDALDVSTTTYSVDKTLLISHADHIEETLYTHLLKSNCLATGQPDWGSVFVHYSGSRIDREGLLKYFISFRKHSGFAEHCVEQIFHDILTECKPERLTVYGRYTRRGGLDINPFRSNFDTLQSNMRLIRQ